MDVATRSRVFRAGALAPSPRTRCILVRPRSPRYAAGLADVVYGVRLVHRKVRLGEVCVWSYYYSRAALGVGGWQRR